MLKIIMTILITCSFSFAYAKHPSHHLKQVVPKIIDLEQLDLAELPWDNFLDWDEISKESHPFNNAIEFGPFFDYLKESFHLERAVETGTYDGRTSKCLAIMFDKVHTIEIQKEYYEIALNNLSSYTNLVVHHGSSPQILRQILPSLKDKRTLFYLDAHWYSDWPLLDELRCISRTHYDNCVIVIDDFKVPGRSDLPYDSYGVHECSYNYIKKTLSYIFSSYVAYYVIPKTVNSRAKFVAFPKKWINTTGELPFLVSSP